MSDETAQETPSTRTELRTTDAAAFLKAHTLAALIVIAAELSIKLPEEAKTKQEHYDAIIAGCNFPDPALRGSSSVGSPVAHVWRRCDEIMAAAGDPSAEGYVAPRRKDMMTTLCEEGVAYYTARTQIQAWKAATRAGSIRLADVDPAELPKVLKPAPEAEEASA